MNADAILHGLAQTSFATGIAQGAVAFPILECIHVIGIAIVIGTIVVIDLHLLGYRSHRQDVRRLMKDLLPYTWAAFGVAVIAGSLLFSSKAPQYGHNWQFQTKMLLILAAAVNMLVFHLTVYRRVHEWGDRLPAPTGAQVAGATSLGLWIAVVFLGRWVGFTL